MNSSAFWWADTRRVRPQCREPADRGQPSSQCHAPPCLLTATAPSQTASRCWVTPSWCARTRNRQALVRSEQALLDRPASTRLSSFRGVASGAAAPSLEQQRAVVVPCELRGPSSAALLLAVRDCASHGWQRRLPAGQVQAGVPGRPGAAHSRVVVSSGAAAGRPRTHRDSAHCLPPAPQSVGKTSIITRFVYDKFDAQYQARVWGPPQDSAAPPPLPSCAETQLHPLLPGCRRPLA